MHYGIEVVPFGEYSHPRKVVELALAAEAAGWEGVWIWDHVVMPYGTGDPWITLAAIAGATRSLKLCTGVSPMPRYQPHLLARTLAGLDLLSDGRVIFGAGLGVDFDFQPFGAGTSAKTRAVMTDEGLALLAQLMAGETVNHNGQYYSAQEFTSVPTPVQKPRIPIWIGGDSPSAYRRAAHWDGWIIGTVNENSEVVKPPSQVAEAVATIQKHRETDAPLDIAIDGVSRPGESALVKEYADAGATWYFEILFGLRGSHAEMLERVHAGPPRFKKNSDLSILKES